MANKKQTTASSNGSYAARLSQHQQDQMYITADAHDNPLSRNQVRPSTYSVVDPRYSSSQQSQMHPYNNAPQEQVSQFTNGDYYNQFTSGVESVQSYDTASAGSHLSFGGAQPQYNGLQYVPQTNLRQSMIAVQSDSLHMNAPTVPTYQSLSARRQSSRQGAQQDVLETSRDTDDITSQLALQDPCFQAVLSDKDAPSVKSQTNGRSLYRPYFVIISTLLQVIGLISSFVLQWQDTGSFIQTKPSFNYMIGPVPEVLIQIGARFAPCMKYVSDLSPTSNRACLIKTSTPDPTTSEHYICSYQDYCGKFSSDPQPNQWYRFFFPIFLHAGLIHFAMNTAFQLTAARSLEKDWGWWRIGFVYMISGVVGFVFGGFFSNELTPSVGSSGALFGIVACLLIDHIQHWRVVYRPVVNLLKMLMIVIFSFALGLLPQIDNFSHIGGFFSGLLAGIVVMPRTDFLSSASFLAVSHSTSETTLPGPGSASRLSQSAAKTPMKQRLRGKVPFLNISPFSAISRLTCLVLLVLTLYGFLSLFYGSRGPNEICPWCTWLDCLPAFSECQATTTK